jgi:hypothetical protein
MKIKPNTVSLRAYQATDIDDDLLWLNQNVDWIKLDTPWEAAVPVDEKEYREDMLAFVAGPGSRRRRSGAGFGSEIPGRQRSQISLLGDAFQERADDEMRGKIGLFAD